jgi:ketosteroid isomerase-like protein
VNTPDERSQDIELVLRCFEAFSGRDIDTLLTMLHSDVEVRSLMTEAERQIYTGHDGVREWLAAVFEIFPDWSPTPTELRDLGGAVLVTMDVQATAAASGVPIDQRVWAAATIRDGKLSWYGFFRTEDDAREAIATFRLRQP